MTAATKTKRDSRTVLKDLLDKVEKDAAKHYPHQSAKQVQLVSHLRTASMILDDMHDTIPSVPHVI